MRKLLEQCPVLLYWNIAMQKHFFETSEIFNISQKNVQGIAVQTSSLEQYIH